MKIIGLKHLNIIIFLIALICYTNLKGQVTKDNGDFVSINTPNSTSLGRLDQVPMSLFNGLANVDIPIYTLSNKTLNVPISLKYNTGGIKTDDHPTWVGSGFTLNCGGSIIRIIKGLKDEYNQDDFLRETGAGLVKVWLGNYNFSKLLDRSDWTSESAINEIVGSVIGNELLKGARDTEPDEFLLSAPGISASFYFVRDINDNLKVKVKSKDGRYIKVKAIFKENLEVDFYTEKRQQYYISNPFFEFEVTSEDGIIYRFGGAVDAIDFYSGYGDRAGIIPTSWYLTEMTGKTGEKIKFTYGRSGNPLIYNNSNVSRLTVVENVSDGAVTAVNNDENLSIVHPAYLKKIESSNGTHINFISKKTNELSYGEIHGTVFGRLRPITAVPVQYFRIDSMTNQNYWTKLEKITINDKINVSFSYRDTITERLRLDKINIATDRDQVQQYSFLYNATKLPAYNAKLADNWGFFNNKYYHNVHYSNLYNYRSADPEMMKAGILTEIVYPLGGRVKFEYEPHQYSKIAAQFPDFKLKNTEGIAGGLRIKKILYFEGKENTPKDSKEYFYELENKSSSGILSGISRYYITGRTHVGNLYGNWKDLETLRLEPSYSQRFYMTSEQNFNVLSTTNGNHVTYSRVVEKNLDKSKSIYNYTNHEEFGDIPPLAIMTNMDDLTFSDPFISMELERGLLKQKIVHNSNDKIIQSTVYKYNSSANRYNNYVKSLAKISYPGIQLVPFVRFVPTIIYTFYPYVEKITETNYDTLGLSPVINEKVYRYYNDFNQIDSVLFLDSKEKKRYIKNKYAFNDESEVSKIMVESNIISDVIEREEGIDGKFQFRKTTDFAVVHEKPLPVLTRAEYSDNDKVDTIVKFTAYDLDGNLLGVSNKQQGPLGYQWGYGASYPVVEIKNADNDVFEKTVNIRENSISKEADIGTLNFHTTQVGDITVVLNQEPGMARFISFDLVGPSSKIGSVMFYRLTSPISGQWLNWKNGGVTDRVTYPNMPIGNYTIRFGSPTKAGSTDYVPKVNVRYQTKTVSENKLKSKEFYYNGFEESAAGAIKPYAGKGCNIGVFTVPFIKPNTKKYYIDYKYYKNGVWILVNKVYENNMVLNEGTAYDEVRVYPSGSEINTYTYDPALGMTSKTDGRGITEFYQYDYMQRLRYILDKDGNVLQSFDYHFRTN